MTNRQKLGVVLLATPIAVAFCLAGFYLGWIAALSILGLTVAVAALIGVGSWLLTGDE